MVTQRTANPCTPVRFRARPPLSRTPRITPRGVIDAAHAMLSCQAAATSSRSLQLLHSVRCRVMQRAVSAMQAVTARASNARTMPDPGSACIHPTASCAQSANESLPRKAAMRRPGGLVRNLGEMKSSQSLGEASIKCYSFLYGQVDTPS